MMLATVGADGRPACRAVLLKGFDERGFTFYTNLESRKAGELAANPYAALLFWWDRLHRQVRVEGPVELVDAAEADAYFASPALRQPDRRLGVAAEPGDRRAGAAGGEGGGAALTVPGGRARPAAAALGRVPGPAGGVRVLAGTAEPAARPAALREARRRLAGGAAGAVTCFPR